MVGTYILRTVIEFILVITLASSLGSKCLYTKVNASFLFQFYRLFVGCSVSEVLIKNTKIMAFESNHGEFKNNIHNTHTKHHFIIDKQHFKLNRRFHSESMHKLKQLSNMIMKP